MVILGNLFWENYGNIILVIRHQRTLVGRQANFVISSGGQANCSTADKPIQHTWIHAAAAMNAAADTETAKTSL